MGAEWTTARNNWWGANGVDYGAGTPPVGLQKCYIYLIDAGSREREREKERGKDIQEKREGKRDQPVNRSIEKPETN